MNEGHISQSDQRLQGAIDELKVMIQQQYPTATFKIFDGEDPEGVYLEATVDVEDTDVVMDILVDRLLEMQIEEELPVYVSLVRPLERVLEEMQRRRTAHLHAGGGALLTF